MFVLGHLLVPANLVWSNAGEPSMNAVTYLLISLITKKNIISIRMKLSVRLKNVMNSMLLIKSNVVLPILMWNGESSEKQTQNSYTQHFIAKWLAYRTYMPHTRRLLTRRTWHNDLDRLEMLVNADNRDKSKSSNRGSNLTNLVSIYRHRFHRIQSGC